MPVTVRPLDPTDFAQLRPMLLDMGFVEDEAALAARFPAFCATPAWVVLGAFEDGTLLGYAAAQDAGADLRSGNSHRTAKLHDLYTLPQARRQGVGRALMKAVETWACESGLRYLYWYANLHEASPAYVGMGYVPGAEVQEGYHFFELNFRAANTRRPHPERGQ
ncbi:GNAT family N-acetyltransferase [Deinococcus arboris]|nr:GNAT family N-acetyltransferase [Deinococcus arboris]